MPAVAGLLSPTTGIVSAHGLMDALPRTRRGATARSCSRGPSSWRSSGATATTGSTIRTPDGVESLTSERVVNAAGLESDTVAALAGIDVTAAGYRLHWWKGSYFAVSGAQGAARSRASSTPSPPT